MKDKDTSWSERARLEFVERVLYWRGYINRRDLMERFGISGPQATNDLVKYTAVAAGNSAYNVRSKRYEAAQDMCLQFVEPDFENDTRDLGASLWARDMVDKVLWAEQPLRTAKGAYLRSLVKAINEGASVEIKYYSLNSGTARWRRISPRAFGNDGLRWHVRAWCHERERFSDFVASRMQGVRKQAPCPFREIEDTDWMATVSMVIEANPELDANRRKALALDYGMQRGVVRLTMRRAMVTYTARRLGFIGDWREADGLPMLNELGELRWRALEPG